MRPFLNGLLGCLVVSQIFGAVAMATCRVTVKAEDNGIFGKGGNPPGPAVVFSRPVPVPAFRLRFVDSSGVRLSPTKISLAYGWRWLEYPYPEHAWGAWSEASDLVECDASTGEVEVPGFEVQPRGWYDGKFTWFPFPKKPSFTGINVVVQAPGCTTGATITPKDALMLKGRVVVIKANCKGESSVSASRP